MPPGVLVFGGEEDRCCCVESRWCHWEPYRLIAPRKCGRTCIYSLRGRVGHHCSSPPRPSLPGFHVQSVWIESQSENWREKTDHRRAEPHWSADTKPAHRTCTSCHPARLHSLHPIPAASQRQRSCGWQTSSGCMWPLLVEVMAPFWIRDFLPSVTASCTY